MLVYYFMQRASHCHLFSYLSLVIELILKENKHINNSEIIILIQFSECVLLSISCKKIIHRILSVSFKHTYVVLIMTYHLIWIISCFT